MDQISTKELTRPQGFPLLADQASQVAAEKLGRQDGGDFEGRIPCIVRKRTRLAPGLHSEQLGEHQQDWQLLRWHA